MTTPSTQPPKFGLLRRWWPACLLVAGVFIAFQPAGNAGFIWDDDRYVTHNPLLTSPDGWWRIWFSFDSPSQYFPLTYSLLRVEHGFWGLDAAGYHWTNLLLHAVNAGLLWKFLERLAVPAAGFAAALFALHPVQVETVAWIAEQKNLLSLLFSLLALHAWLSFLRDQTGGWRNYTRALIYFALALFAKTTACTLTIALLLVCWWERKPIHRQRWIQVAPFFAAGLLMGLVTIWWERFHQGTEGKLFHLGLVERVLLASRAMWFYLGKLLWPANLIFSYPKWTIQTSALSAWLWLVAGVLAAAFICALRRRMGRGLAVAAIFFVATLSPLLGFVMLYTFRYTFVADHYQYVACIGPLALAAAVWKFFCERWGRRGRWLQIFGAAGIIALLATLTWRQCGMYRDAETLWRATLARNPGSSLAHNNLGTLLMRSGRTDEAIPHFEAALAAQPDYAVACHNLGRALAEKGLLDAAIARFEQAVRLDPEYPSPRINLGNALVQRGRFPEAKEQFEAALKLRPRQPDVLNNLAWLLATCPDDGLRDGLRSVELAGRAVELSRGRDPIYLGTLAAAYAESKRFDEAVATAEQAGRIAGLSAETKLVEALAAQKELYSRKLPFRTKGASIESGASRSAEERLTR